MSVTPTQATQLMFAGCLIAVTVAALVMRYRRKPRRFFVFVMCGLAFVAGYLPFKLVPRNMPQPASPADTFTYFDAWHAGRVAVLDALSGYVDLLLLILVCFGVVAMVGDSRKGSR